MNTRATIRRLARLYVECVGYDPFDDDERLTAREVLETLKGWRDEVRAAECARRREIHQDQESGYRITS